MAEVDATAAAPGTPLYDADTAPYWEGAAAGELRLRRCRDCGNYNHFPSPICPRCGSRNLSWEKTGGVGSVYSFVVIHRSTIPPFTERDPYAVAWIELDDQPGLRVLSDLPGCDPAAVEIGARAEVFFDDSLSVAIPRFRLVG